MARIRVGRFWIMNLQFENSVGGGGHGDSTVHARALCQRLNGGAELRGGGEACTGARIGAGLVGTFTAGKRLAEDGLIWSTAVVGYLEG